MKDYFEVCTVFTQAQQEFVVYSRT